MRIACTIVFVLFLWPCVAGAQVSLGIGDATLEVGDSGSVFATLTTDGSAVALQFDVLYDASRVVISSVTPGTALSSDHSLASSAISPGRERIVITSSPVAPLLSGTLAAVSITARDNAPAGDTPLTWDGIVISSATANPILAATAAAGTITITAAAAPTDAAPIPTLPNVAIAVLILLLVLLSRRAWARPLHTVVLPLLAAGCLLLSPGAEAQGIPGDANGDGRLDIEDVRLIVEHILERGELVGDGDCNRDDTINVLDTVCSQLPFVSGETSPIILNPGNRSIPADRLFEMNLFAADPDTGSTASWELLGGPAGLSVSAAGTLNWRPGSDDIGGNAVSVRVTDDTARSSEAAFTITVYTEPVAPLANVPPKVSVPENQTLTVGGQLAVQVTATDADAGDNVTFRLLDSPPGLTIDSSSGDIRWIPQERQVRSWDVAVEATDRAGESDFASFRVAVTALNGAPSARDDIYIARAGETLVIDAASGVLANDYDPNADALLATQQSSPGRGNLDSFSANGSFSYTPRQVESIDIGLLEKCRTAPRVYAGTMSAADVDGDGDVELVALVEGGRNRLFTEVFVVDPRDCSSTGASINEALGAASNSAVTTLVNLDDDPELELVGQYFRFNRELAEAGAEDDRLYAVNLDGSQLANWPAGGLSEADSFDTVSNSGHVNASPVPVDLNGDGFPELIMGFTNVAGGTVVQNTTRNAVVAYDGFSGRILWEYIGGITRSIRRAATPTIVDLDMDGDTEIIWNQLVLDHEGNLLFELPVEQTITNGGSDFLNVAIANFDNDAFPEILGIDASNIYLFSHDGAIQWQRAYRGGGFGFPFTGITVAELDGDPFPEFATMLQADGGGNLTLRAFDSDGEPLWDQAAAGFIVADYNESASSTPVAFDFNNDGLDEIIQFKSATRGNLQPSGLYIINGEDGEVITFKAGNSGSYYDEALTVADVDGDGSAEIITNMVTEYGADTVQIWDNLPGEPFPPARPIRSGTNSHPTWINVDGSLPTSIAPHWLQPGRNGWHMIQPDIDPLAPEHDSFTYVANDGEFDSAIATVNIEIRPVGNPPFFLSEPDRGATRGIAYRYEPLVVDIDPGDLVSFELIAGPAGMTIDTATGALNWYPESHGDYPVSIVANDTLGFSTAQIFTLSVGDPVRVPNVVGTTEVDAEAALVAAGLQKGSVYLISHSTLPAGEVYEQRPSAGAVVAISDRVALYVSSGPGAFDRDDDGDGFSENEGDCDDADRARFPGAVDINDDGIDQDCDGVDGSKRLVAIELDPVAKRVLTNQPVPIKAMGIFEDGSAQNLSSVANWTRGPTFLEGAAGAYTAEARFAGVTGTSSITVIDRADDELAPIARIDTPASGASVAAPVDIVGTASDDNLLRWELAYQYAGEDEFVLFAEGSSQRVSGVIGRFDPTTLLNGLYNIRLRVLDAGGNESEDTTTVVVDSQFKVGNFSLRYVDLELPLNGIPITVVRSYDSRDKRQGDFGVGWQLGVDSVEIRTNRELGSGWQVLRSGLTYGLAETDAHLAAIQMPNGRVEVFRMVVGPAVSPIVPFPPFSQSVRFEALPGTRGTLESLEVNNISILDPQPGPVSLRLDSNGDVYNPTLFRYTAPDGTKLDLDILDGIQRAETPAGQVLTFTPTSITHSNGTVVDIGRDAAGRITAITDAAGFSQTYSYDANGNLRAHSDQEDFVTRFDYDANHNIVRITDPLGRNVVRNDYDEQGRLISATNAAGNTIRYSHDVAGRRELVTDPDGFVTAHDYDDDGNVVRVTDPLGGVTVNTFDERGNPLTVTNPEGETTTFTYDSRDNRLSATDPVGATTTYSYDASDRMLTRTDALGRQTKYEYDESGRLQRITNPAGKQESQRFWDASGSLIADMDARGNTRRYERNAQGYAVATIDPRGNRSTSQLNANGIPVSTTDARGGVNTLELDRRGWIEKVTAPEGNYQNFVFDAQGEIATVSDAAGNAASQVLDASGRITRFTGPDGGVNQFFYDARGNRIRQVDGSGLETNFKYDALGRLVQTRLGEGGVAETTYDAVGRVLSDTDPNGNTTSYEYDPAGSNTAVTDALGNRTEFSYDLVGNLSARLDARGNTTRYRYDVLDRLVETEYPDGSTETVAYDEIGNVIAETDRLGRTKLYGYDQNNNLVSVTDTDGGVSTFAYDENNNRIEQVDAKGRSTRMLYDANNRLVEKRYPDGSTEAYEYNALGQIARMTLPDGKYVDSTYDGFGRPAGHDLNGEASESFSYDGAGRLSEASNLWGTVEYSYDSGGRVIEIRSEGGHTVQYGYDDSGNRTSISTRLNGQPERVTLYSYDALNRLATVQEPDGDITSYTYDPVGNVASMTYPNGVVSGFTYDNVNQLTRIEHRQGASLLAAYDYTLDAGGRRLRVDHANGDSVSYDYDSADRLLLETHRNSSNVVVFEQTFSYDAVGNRLTQRVSGQAQTLFSYDSADKLLSAGALSFAYDANGRLIARNSPQGIIGYDYDVEGQLLRVTTSMGTVTYGYDASGKRRQRSHNGSEQNYLLDEASLTGYDQTLVAFDGSGSQLAEYHWGDRLISADDGANDRFYHFDAGGNTRLLTDEVGVVSDSYDYEAFGRVRNRTGVADNPYGFAGESQQNPEGLIYLRARFYDPTIGRFVSRDPFSGTAEDPVSLHRYLYANANPIMYTDPSGMESFTLKGQMAVGAIINVTISLVSDYLSNASPTEMITNAVIAAGFGAAGGAVGGGLAWAGQKMLVASVAQTATQRGVIFLSIVTVKSAVNTLIGVYQSEFTDALGTTANNVSPWVMGKIFVVNLVVETVTLGYGNRFSRMYSQPYMADSALSGSASSRTQKLFDKWIESGGDIFDFLVKAGKGKSPKHPANAILAYIDEMHGEAAEILQEEFVVRLKVIDTPKALEAFVESARGAFIVIAGS